MTTDHTPAEAGAGALAALVETVEDVQDDLFRVGGDKFVRRLAPVATALRAHRCFPSVVPSDATEGGDVPRRGGAVEAWIKARRDRLDRDGSPEERALWDELDEALEDLRERADTGAPWSGRMVDYGDGRPQHEPDDDLLAASPQGEAQGRDK